MKKVCKNPPGYHYSVRILRVVLRHLTLLCSHILLQITAAKSGGTRQRLGLVFWLIFESFTAAELVGQQNRR